MLTTENNTETPKQAKPKSYSTCETGALFLYEAALSRVFLTLGKG